MTLISFERRLRKIEAQRNTNVKEMQGLSDDELEAIILAEPVDPDDVKMVAWLRTGEVPPDFDVAEYAGRYLR